MIFLALFSFIDRAQNLAAYIFDFAYRKDFELYGMPPKYRRGFFCFSLSKKAVMGGWG